MSRRSIYPRAESRRANARRPNSLHTYPLFHSTRSLTTKPGFKPQRPKARPPSPQSSTKDQESDRLPDIPDLIYSQEEYFMAYDKLNSHNNRELADVVMNQDMDPDNMNQCMLERCVALLLTYDRMLFDYEKENPLEIPQGLAHEKIGFCHTMIYLMDKKANMRLLASADGKPSPLLEYHCEYMSRYANTLLNPWFDDLQKKFFNRIMPSTYYGHCSVCQGKMYSVENIKTLTCPWNHRFHGHCLKRWYAVHKEGSKIKGLPFEKNCPFCRRAATIRGYSGPTRKI